MATKLNRSLNLLIAAGGTGGHLFPGIAVAEQLRRENADATITFVGTGREIEAKILGKYDFDYVIVKSPRLERSLHPKNLLIPILLQWAIIKSWMLLGEVKPDAVIGTGSYGSVPVVLAAKMRRIPTMILEQNIIPSITNRLLARVTNAISLTFAPARDWLKGKAQIYITGNPIRLPSNISNDKAAARRDLGLFEDKFTVAVFGGSQGALSIATAVKDALPLLVDENIQLIAQTAAGIDIEVNDDWQGRLLLSDFFEDIYKCYAAADIVVGRAGSGLNEVLAFGIPMIVVPYPYSAHNHQERNAIYLEQEGAAIVLDDAIISGKLLAKTIIDMKQNAEQLENMGRAARELGRIDAAERVVKIVRTLAAKTRSGE